MVYYKKLGGIIYIWFSLFIVVMFCKVAGNTELMNSEPFSYRKTGLGSFEPLGHNTCINQSIYKLVSHVFLFKDNLI